MAKKRRKRAATKTKTVYRRAKGVAGLSRGWGGVLDKVINGGLVALGQRFVPGDALWGMARPGVPLAVGWWRKDPTLQTLGGLAVGTALINKFVPGGNGGGTVGGGGLGWL